MESPYENLQWAKHFAVGEVYLDGVNVGEPVGGWKGLDDVRNGDVIESYSVEVVDLRHASAAGFRQRDGVIVPTWRG